MKARTKGSQTPTVAGGFARLPFSANVPLLISRCPLVVRLVLMLLLVPAL